MLARLKSLRGGAFDLFGYTAERQQERQDIDDYLLLLEQLKGGLTKENYDIALQLCRSPEKLRGFGPVKAANREKVKQLQVTLLKQFHNRDDEMENAA